MKDKKRIIFDVGHPAQVHHFKCLYYELSKLNWDGLFTVKDKEVAVVLLDSYGLPYRVLAKHRGGALKKLLQLPLQLIKFNRIVQKFKPDVVLSRSSMHSAWISKLHKINHISFADTENSSILDKITLPLIESTLTAFSYKHNLGKNHIRYNGNIELFYLHPNRFAPNKSIYKDLGIAEKEQYAIVRFVSWDAHHDVGLSGITLENKIRLVQELSKLMRVFITSEKELPKELKPYQISIKPERMHDAIAYSSFLVGESATMASEAAVLGVPSVYIDEVGRGYTDEEGEYGLVYNYKPSEQDEAIDKALEVAKDMAQGGDSVYKRKHKEFLQDKIDPTAFLVWFVEHYPESRDIMKKYPDYQYRFK